MCNQPQGCRSPFLHLPSPSSGFAAFALDVSVVVIEGWMWSMLIPQGGPGGHHKTAVPSQEPSPRCRFPCSVYFWRMKRVFHVACVCHNNKCDFCLFLFFLLETKHHLNHCRGFSLLAQLALPHKSPTQTSSKRCRQHKHEIPSKGRKLKGPWSQAVGCALRTPDLDIETGILEASTPANLLSHSIVTELHDKSVHFH